MKRQQSGVLELGQLLTDVSAEGIAHLEEVQADLAQTRLLLAEAIGRLSDGFSALHAAVSIQRAAAEQLQQQQSDGGSSGGGDDDGQAQLRDAAAAIDTQVQAMVTALQFEDMTSQLIAQAGRRIAGLQGILAGVGDGAQGLATGDLTQLESVRAAMAAQSRELDGLLARSVDQRHLESGDITLF